MKEEAQRILAQALTAPDKFSDVFKKYFGLKNGNDLDLLNQRNPHNPVDFNE